MWVSFLGKKSKISPSQSGEAISLLLLAVHMMPLQLYLCLWLTLHEIAVSISFFLCLVTSFWALFSILSILINWVRSVQILVGENSQTLSNYPLPSNCGSWQYWCMFFLQRVRVEELVWVDWLCSVPMGTQRRGNSQVCIHLILSLLYS